MFQSQGTRRYSPPLHVGRFGLAVAVAALMAAGCSNQTTNQAKGPAPTTVKKAPATTKATAKPAAAPSAQTKAAAKPAPKPAQTSPTAAAKASAKQTPKQVNASSKTPVAAKSTDVAKTGAPTSLVALPKGTVLSAKLAEGLASSKNRAGDTFAAVLTSSVKVDGRTVIPRGTHVTGRVVTVRRKNPELTVALASVDLNGKSYKLATEPVAAGKSTVKANAGDGDPATAPKEITVPAERRLKFKLARTVKLPTGAKS